MDVVAQFYQSIPYDQIVIQTLNGIVTGMILALVASGLTLIFGIMDVAGAAPGGGGRPPAGGCVLPGLVGGGAAVGARGPGDIAPDQEHCAGGEVPHVHDAE